MSCIIIAEFRCKPGRAKDFIELCRANYPGTRDYDGCEYISLSVDQDDEDTLVMTCLLYTSPSPRDGLLSRMPSSA